MDDQLVRIASEMASMDAERARERVQEIVSRDRERLLESFEPLKFDVSREHNSIIQLDVDGRVLAKCPQCEREYHLDEHTQTARLLEKMTQISDELVSFFNKLAAEVKGVSQ